MTRHLPTVARIFLGLIFFVFGLNGFLNFIPTPPPPEPIVAFMKGLMSTGYFFPLLKATEVTCGALLLSNRLVPLALIVLSPIIVQIFAFHVLLAHNGYPMTVLLVAAQAYLGWAYRNHFRSVLVVKATPERSEKPASHRQEALNPT
jgi:uncharacterized membrane protein YphA (DoxX/SURF4 family)